MARCSNGAISLGEEGLCALSNSREEEMDKIQDLNTVLDTTRQKLEATLEVL